MPSALSLWIRFPSITEENNEQRTKEESDFLIHNTYVEYIHTYIYIHTSGRKMALFNLKNLSVHFECSSCESREWHCCAGKTAKGLSAEIPCGFFLGKEVSALSKWGAQIDHNFPIKSGEREKGTQCIVVLCVCVCVCPVFCALFFFFIIIIISSAASCVCVVLLRAPKWTTHPMCGAVLLWILSARFLMQFHVTFFRLLGKINSQKKWPAFQEEGEGESRSSCAQGWQDAWQLCSLRVVWFVFNLRLQSGVCAQFWFFASWSEPFPEPFLHYCCGSPTVCEKEKTFYSASLLL